MVVVPGLPIFQEIGWQLTRRQLISWARWVHIEQVQFSKPTMIWESSNFPWQFAPTMVVGRNGLQLRHVYIQLDSDFLSFNFPSSRSRWPWNGATLPKQRYASVGKLSSCQSYHSMPGRPAVNEVSRGDVVSGFVCLARFRFCILLLASVVPF